MKNYPNHHRNGPHILYNRMHSTENSWCVRAYQIPRMPLVKESYGIDTVNAWSRIHPIEKEAYAAVLRAFVAQSDVLSWGKEGLITELRRELNITDQEHGSLLTEINADESVKMIREWRKGNTLTQELTSDRVDSPGFVCGYVSGSSHKILKASHAGVSTLRRYVSYNQPTSEANLSTFPVRCRAGLRAGELPTYSAGTGNAEQSFPSARKCREPMKPQSKRRFYVADIYDVGEKSDIIEICATDELMYKVECMIYGNEKPDPVLVEKAKSILMEQEAAILEALAKLADMSHGGLPGGGPESRMRDVDAQGLVQSG